MQAEAVQQEHNLVPVTVTLEAVGVMEWQGDTDRDLYIHPTLPSSDHSQYAPPPSRGPGYACRAWTGLALVIAANWQTIERS